MRFRTRCVFFRIDPGERYDVRTFDKAPEHVRDPVSAFRLDAPERIRGHSIKHTLSAPLQLP